VDAEIAKLDALLAGELADINELAAKSPLAHVGA
jgi:hypothetical protein